MRSYKDGIDREMRRGSMSSLSANSDIKLVGAGHHHTPAKAQLPRLEAGMHMQSENGLWRWGLQHPFLDHQPRSRRILFLPRLEDQLDRPFPLVFKLIQSPGRSQQHRGMDIMPAGMHDP